jgi:hypothetical protein
LWLSRHSVSAARSPVVAAPRPCVDTAAIAVYPTTSPQSAQTTSLVKRLRSNVLPPLAQATGATVYVGGATATQVDFAHVLSGKLPLFIGLVVLLSALLLLVVFRSLLIPLQAAFMNLLSIAAALGVVQAIFERGWLAGLIGVQPGPIDAFIPVMVFAIVFGLSMDYEVFLVSRIHEEWQHRGDASAAVREGLANTGRVITAAAAVMVVVFASFAAGDDRVLKLFGVAMATAVSSMRSSSAASSCPRCSSFSAARPGPSRAGSTAGSRGSRSSRRRRRHSHWKRPPEALLTIELRGARRPSVQFRWRQSQAVAGQGLEAHLGSRTPGELLGQPPDDRARDDAPEGVPLQIGEGGLCVDDAALARTPHDSERLLGEPFVPQVGCDAPYLARDLGRVAFVQCKRHEAEAGMTDALVEIELERRREHVGPALRELLRGRHTSSRAQEVCRALRRCDKDALYARA